MRSLVIKSVVSVASLFPAIVMAAADTYAIDSAHTSVTFEVAPHFFAARRGRFEKNVGLITIDRATKTGHVEVTIDAGSISTGTTAFDRQLKSKNFFNTEAFPDVKFSGDSLLFKGDRLVGVAGNLTLLGRSQPVTIQAKTYHCYESTSLKREVCGGDAEATIQRSAFGMQFGLPVIPDEVKLVIQLEAIKQIAD